MTTPDDVYAALCARFGKDAVDVLLSSQHSCNWFGGADRLRCVDERTDQRMFLPAPVALAVLCEVGEAMLWEADGIVITRHRDASLPFGVAEYGCYPKRVASTKPAAIVAACGAKQ